MVQIVVKSNYPFSVDVSKIEKALLAFFAQEKFANVFVNVSLVGEKEMLDLAQTFLHESGVLHNVLSFTESEARQPFVYPPGHINYLGEIVLCVPKIASEAEEDGSEMATKLVELAIHGATHLLGRHHS